MSARFQFLPILFFTISNISYLELLKSLKNFYKNSFFVFWCFVLLCVLLWLFSSFFLLLQFNLSSQVNNRLLSKLAYADEVQGVDGAQKLSVQKLLDASSTGATKQFAAEVEFGKKSNDCDQTATWYLLMNRR